MDKDLAKLIYYTSIGIHNNIIVYDNDALIDDITARLFHLIKRAFKETYDVYPDRFLINEEDFEFFYDKQAVFNYRNLKEMRTARLLGIKTCVMQVYGIDVETFSPEYSKKIVQFFEDVDGVLPSYDEKIMFAVSDKPEKIMLGSY